jgi:hypothetical protein
MPELKYEQRPKLFVVACKSALMFGHQLVDMCGLEEALVSESSRRQQIVHHRVQPALEPFGDGNAKAFL